jgi:hypothetical protein
LKEGPRDVRIDPVESSFLPLIRAQDKTSR